MVEMIRAQMRDRGRVTPLPAAGVNLLLATLPAEDRDRLTGCMDRVQLSRGQILCGEAGPPSYTYFPTGGLTSILAVTRLGYVVGIAAVGKEGAVGWPAVFPGRGPAHQIVVEVAGRAHRIESDALRAAFETTGALQNVLLVHTQRILTQISRSVVCQRFHAAPQRLARWLLVVSRHAESNRVGLTQAGIARTLGIQPTAVTSAASELKNAGVISYQHGQLVIVNRQRLEREACDCYRADDPDW
jgi:CRP-like cAMP-binding protein